ncbi:terminase, partial [Mesorhizobium sp. M7D.F.Ca.US.004.01.2.1]
FDTCIHTIRTLPALQHDEAHPEDLDTKQEDHAADETRYACMSRPWTGKPKERPKEIPKAGQIMLPGAPDDGAGIRRIRV